jgi:phosphatidylglycerophosphate synthase
VKAAEIDVTRVRKPVTTLFGWLLYRRISVPLSLRLARTKVHPSHITALGLAAGLAGAAMLATGSQALLLGGALLVNVAKLLDAVDGEVARVKGLDTSTGYVLDGLADRLRDTAALVGCGVGALRTGSPAALAWTVGAIVGYLGFFYVSAAAPSHWREVRSASDLDEKHSFRVSGALRLGAGDTLAVLVLVAALAGRPLWVDIAVAAASPAAIALKVRKLLTLRPWDSGEAENTGP